MLLQEKAIFHCSQLEKFVPHVSIFTLFTHKKKIIHLSSNIKIIVGKTVQFIEFFFP